MKAVAFVWVALLAGCDGRVCVDPTPRPGGMSVGIVYGSPPRIMTSWDDPFVCRWCDTLIYDPKQQGRRSGGLFG